MEWDGWMAAAPLCCCMEGKRWGRKALLILFLLMCEGDSLFYSHSPFLSCFLEKIISSLTGLRGGALQKKDVFGPLTVYLYNTGW